MKFFENYNACYTCSGKVVPRSDVIGHCNKSESMQRLERCILKASAKVDIQATELEFEEDIHTLSVFSPVIKDICQVSARVETLVM